MSFVLLVYVYSTSTFFSMMSIMSTNNNGIHSRRTTREIGGAVSNGNRSSSNSNSRIVGNDYDYDYDYGDNSAIQQPQRRRKKKKSTTKCNIIAVGYLLIIMYWYRNIFDDNKEEGDRSPLS